MLARTAITIAPTTIQATVSHSTIVGNLLEVVDRRVEHRLARDAAQQVGDLVDVAHEQQAQRHADARADDAQAQSRS